MRWYAMSHRHGDLDQLQLLLANPRGMGLKSSDVIHFAAILAFHTIAVAIMLLLSGFLNALASPVRHFAQTKARPDRRCVRHRHGSSPGGRRGSRAHASGRSRWHVPFAVGRTRLCQPNSSPVARSPLARGFGPPARPRRSQRRRRAIPNRAAGDGCLAGRFSRDPPDLRSSQCYHPDHREPEQAPHGVGQRAELQQAPHPIRRLGKSFHHRQLHAIRRAWAPLRRASHVLRQFRSPRLPLYPGV